MPNLYVNTYRIQLAYGGPEEGGWYYSVGTAIRTAAAFCDEQFEDEYGAFWADGHSHTCPIYHLWVEAKEEAEQAIDTFYPVRENPDPMADPEPETRGEILSSGNELVTIEASPGQNFPDHRPIYE